MVAIPSTDPNQSNNHPSAINVFTLPVGTHLVLGGIFPLRCAAALRIHQFASERQENAPTDGPNSNPEDATAAIPTIGHSTNALGILDRA